MDKLTSLLTRKQGSIRSASLVLMIMVLTSRILGLVRDRMLSSRFVPEELGVYFAAFRLPNLIFELLVMGALTAAFIPVFTRLLSEEKEGQAHRLASILINFSLLFFAILVLPFFFWTTQISQLLAPGFNQEQIALMTSFTRFMFAFQVIPLLIGNFFTGILQSYNLFLVPALAPVAYNLGIILGIVILGPIFGLWAPVIGVGIGAMLFMFIQYPSLLATGFRHKLILSGRASGVKEVGKLMGPRTLGLAASQIDTTVDLILASLLGAKMVTVFNFAQHLQQLPVGLFGMTVAQAALPALARQTNGENLDEFKKIINKSLTQILFFILPISALFIVLRIPAVRLVFGAARFDWEATILTGKTLSAFSISLFAQAISQVLIRGFYALFDSKTPVIISFITILINAILSLIFIRIYHWPVWSLGLSTSIASILNFFLLFIFLDRKVAGFSRREIIIPGLKIIIATILAAIAVYLPLKLFDQLVFDTTRVFGLLLLTGLSGATGLTIYFLICWVLGVGEVHSFLELLKKVRRPKAIIIEPTSTNSIV